MTYLSEESLFAAAIEKRPNGFYLTQIVRRQLADGRFPKRRAVIYEFFDWHHDFYRWRLTRDSFWSSNADSTRSIYYQVALDDLEQLLSVRAGKRLREADDTMLHTLTTAESWGLVPVFDAYLELKAELENKTGRDSALAAARMLQSDLVPIGKDTVLVFKLYCKEMQVFRGKLARVEPNVRAGDWTPVDSFPVDFQEPFQAWLLGDAYYFLTKSGRLYNSPKSKGGKRNVEQVPTEGGRPITIVVTDVKAQVGFAFSAPTPREGKAPVGTLIRFNAEKVTAQPYGAGGITPVKEPGPVGRAVEHAQFLIGGKFIRVK